MPGRKTSVNVSNSSSCQWKPATDNSVFVHRVLRDDILRKIVIIICTLIYQKRLLAVIVVFTPAYSLRLLLETATMCDCHYSPSFLLFFCSRT